MRSKKLREKTMPYTLTPRPGHRRNTRAMLVVLVSLVVFASTAWGQATSLFFSEYVEGTFLNKALEIYNGTGVEVDLAAEGYEIEIYFNGNTASGTPIALTGVVADGDVYVISHRDADVSITDVADQTSTGILFNGNDAVALVKDGVFVDVIGQIGFDPGSEWGTGDVSTGENTLRRRPEVCAGDPTGTDAFGPSMEWGGFAQNTFDGLGTHSATCLAQRIQILEAIVDEFRNHTHTYLTGRGEGHNNTTAETGPAIPVE